VSKAEDAMRSLKSSLGMLSVVGVVGIVSGCASAVPPRELVDARTAYESAKKGPAAQYDPAALHVAQESLQTAENSFAGDGDSAETRDLAYAAQRRSQLAEAQARVKVAQQETAEAQKQVQLTQADVAKRTRGELNQTREQLQMNQQQLEAERARRMEAEKRAQQAAADLARIAAVKQEPRGMVITLSGAVLFASAKSALLPQAQVKLNEVADALVKGDPDSKITVEGYTDSQGAASFNQDLSQKRAQSVRDYLVSRGIASDRVDAVGFGPDKPVADNASAEGRANNRRVEIVVKPAQGSASSPSTTSPRP
jgi:outer membrane protein OmpA-like peptidoglycan-associated protein